ncbi:MAG: hypothetical protein DRR19_23355 [Candidatus Parabeggiatoa sp. nov. 1]|nr:MAG: hypothetical protein DRR19_23355 [Gammaproteobacteria bacterium]
MKFHATYLKYFFSFLISLLLSVAAFNWLIDPFGKYQVIKIAGINTEKTQVEVIGIRTIKAIGLLGADYRAVILGTSRANNAINPAHEIFAEIGATYNASLAGTNIYELEKVFNYVLKHHPNLTTVVFSLDFLTFSSRRTVNADFEQSMFSEQFSLWTKLSNTFSVDEAYYSVKTIIDNSAQKQAAYHAILTKQGFANRTFPLPHHQLFINILSKNFFVNKQTYAGFCYSQDRLNRFKRMIEKSRQRGIVVRLFISPIHAWQLEALRIMGLSSTFEQWKRDLTAILAQDAAQHPDKYPLWDFTGYNSLTTEAIPVAPQQPMQWYWESSHFKKELADLVLDKLFDYHSPDRVIPDDFGVLINSDNIEAHLLMLREAQQRYHQTHPEDIAEIEALAAKTMRKFELPCP